MASPRPDFDGAIQEFLIGLLTTAVMPSEREWRAFDRKPPTPEELQDYFDRLPSAFDLDGDGPRFFQDLTAADFTDIDPKPIDQILIDSPGDQTVRQNKDLFVKRDRVDRLGRPAAAMALLTLQTYAPAGGQGHRTSLRGGGPLTTLVEPRVEENGKSRAHELPLWTKLWANVDVSDSFTDVEAGLDQAFPWLHRTRTSDGKGKSTTPEHVHPLQAYFGLPRRIRLDFDEAGTCELTEMPDERTVSGFRMRNFGTQYENWEHPLSPYYRQNAGAPWLPVHGQPNGIGWRDWISLTLHTPDTLRKPARVISSYSRRAPDRLNYRMQAFGYDMDNMKARGWTNAEMPAFVAVDGDRETLLFNTASALADATGITGTALVGAVRSALFQGAEDARGDFGEVRSRLWTMTEAAFFDTMRALADPSLSPTEADRAAMRRRQGFADTLREAALTSFDSWAPASATASGAIRRRVSARYNLLMTLNGVSKPGEKVFNALGIPLPGGGFAIRAKRSRKESVT